MGDAATVFVIVLLGGLSFCLGVCVGLLSGRVVPPPRKKRKGRR